MEIGIKVLLTSYHSCRPIKAAGAVQLFLCMYVFFNVKTTRVLLPQQVFSVWPST